MIKHNYKSEQRKRMNGLDAVQCFNCFARVRRIFKDRHPILHVRRHEHFAAVLNLMALSHSEPFYTL